MTPGDLLQVTEGGMTELTPSILDGSDLDVPSDLLTFTVEKPPAHGRLINGIHGAELSRSKKTGTEQLQSNLHITSFTLQELKQGETESTSPPGPSGCRTG